MATSGLTRPPAIQLEEFAVGWSSNPQEPTSKHTPSSAGSSRPVLARQQWHQRCLRGVAECGSSFVTWSKSVGSVCRKQPTTLIAPLLVLAMCIAISVWGVLHASDVAEQQLRARVHSVLEHVSDNIQSTMLAQLRPASHLETVVQVTPNWAAVKAGLQLVAPQLLLESQGSVVSIILMPQGIISAIYPPDAATTSADHTFSLNTDVFTSSPPGFADYLIASQHQTFGPLPLGSGLMADLTMNAVFVPNVSTFDATGFGFGRAANCSLCFNPTTKQQFWGFTASFSLYESTFDPLDLQEDDLNYVLMTDPTLSNGVSVARARSTNLPAQPPESEFIAGVGTLSIAPGNGWDITWKWPLVAGVVLLSILMSVLVLCMEVSRRRHQLLLQALVPRNVLQQLQRAPGILEHTAVIDTGTAADRMLSIIRDVLEGRMPSTSQALLVRTTILQSQDIYAAMNLGDQMAASNLDHDVASALMRQLGGKSSFNDDAWNSPAPRDSPQHQHHRREHRPSNESVASESVAVFDTLSEGIAGIVRMGRTSLDVDVMGGKACGVLDWGLSDSVNDMHRSLSSSGAGVGVPLPSVITATAAIAPRQTAALQCGGPPVRVHSGKVKPPSRLGHAHSGSTGQYAALVLQNPTFDSSSSTAGTCYATAGGGPESPSGTSAVLPSPMLQVERLLASTNEWHFNAFQLAEVTQGRPLSTLAFYLFHQSGMMGLYKIKGVVLARFLVAIEEGYRPNPYHNATHAADVLQTFHVLLTRGGLLPNYADSATLMACYLAAAIHDYEHMGLTNDFLISTIDPLALLYNDKQPQENHHLAAAFTLLRQPQYNFLADLSRAEMDKLRKMVIELVLGTEMKQHFALIAHFSTVHRLAAAPAALSSPSPVQSTRRQSLDEPNRALAHESMDRPTGRKSPVSPPPARQPLDEAERLLSLQLALKCADLGHLCEGLQVHLKWVSMLETEFFIQGDKEKELGLPISPLFDRTKPGVSKSQVGFISFVVLPLFQAFTTVFPDVNPMLSSIHHNFAYWGRAAAATVAL